MGMEKRGRLRWRSKRSIAEPYEVGKLSKYGSKGRNHLFRPGEQAILQGDLKLRSLGSIKLLSIGNKL
ncbi:hypothetical protein C4D60_Mb00t19910 [Musa balbisiana]|uniref:Uncharacterized protein n=1 Tax=Musa balbisiana TaxID=52838 RepID=A0A4S8I3V7_MUSBA|nr:hypothetical protein C4D60_Mb00t19910 [Musa balbisiana]